MSKSSFYTSVVETENEILRNQIKELKRERAQMISKAKVYLVEHKFSTNVNSRKIKDFVKAITS